jgi:hypothetical protein
MGGKTMKKNVLKWLEKVAEWYLAAVMIIIFFGGTFAAALWIVKCIIKLVGGM